MQAKVCLGQIELDDMDASGGKDRAVMEAEPAGASGSDGDPTGQVHEGVGAVTFGEPYPDRRPLSAGGRTACTQRA